MPILPVRFVAALVALLTGVAIAMAAWPDLAGSMMLRARVSAWTHDVVAPITGRVANDPLAPGARVGPDGVILEIVNGAVDRTPLRNAEAAFEAAQSRLAAANKRLEALRLAEETRRDSILRLRQVGRTREAAAEIGAVGAELGAARAAEREGLHVLLVEREAYEVNRAAVVKAPAGAFIYSIVPAGASVGSGDSIARWIDCGDLLVDAPIFDAWLPLLSVGGRGQVMLEGETVWRDGEIFALRRSSELAQGNELAAVAKGRDRGAGQALLKLAGVSSDVDRCPVGRAAYVRLPDLELLARLARFRP